MNTIFFAGVVAGVAVFLAILIVAPPVIAHVTRPYFLEDYGSYAEAFMELEEVAALYRAYPTAEQGLTRGGYLMYAATANDGNQTIQLSIHHKPLSFEIVRMFLTCEKGGDAGVLYVYSEDIVRHIDNRRCF